MNNSFPKATSLQITLFSLLLLTITGSGCDRSGVKYVDTVLRNGKVVTLDEQLGEQEAMAMSDGRIVAVGSNAEVDKMVGPDTRVIDLDGRLAVPGFIEGHGHFMSIGTAKQILDLRTPATWAGIVSMVEEAAATAEPGEIIRGRGWHQDKWTTPPSPSLEGFPLGHDLSAVSPNNPVILTHASGHASFVNQAALDAAGITNSTPNPDGGEILREANGRAIGLLRETAQDLVDSIDEREQTAEETLAIRKKTAGLAAQDVISKGITTFQDAGVSVSTIDLYRQLIAEGELPVRMWVMIAGGSEDLENKLQAYRTIGEGNDHLTVRGIKLSLDGALGSRGAWMLEPYSDAPQLDGLNLISIDYLKSTAALAKKYDFQLCVHAIGDRANREVLDVYETVFDGDGVDRRWRIEHAQHLNPVDIPRFGELGVIASMQAVHCTSDAPWVPDRIGDKRAEEGAYVWQKLMETGAIVTNGTDAPVEDVDPLASYYSSVTRLMANGKTFYPDQRMSRIEGLKAYTINNAYGGFEDDVKGTLSIGKLGDVVVLSNDILTVPDEALLETKVDYTIVGGQVVYSRNP